MKKEQTENLNGWKHDDEVQEYPPPADYLFKVQPAGIGQPYGSSMARPHHGAMGQSPCGSRFALCQVCMLILKWTEIV